MELTTPTTARLLYTTGVRRSLYVRYFLRALLGVLAAVAVGLALAAGERRGLVSPLIANLGALLAFALGLWFSLRLVARLVQLFSRRSVTVRLYDRGIVWYEKGRTTKHRWSEVIRYREGIRAVRLFGRPLLTWGAHVLTTENGNEYRFTPGMGDARVFAQYVRPYCSHVTSLRMGKALRSDQPVKLSERLTIYPGGVAVGKTEVPWAELRVTVDPSWRRITLRRMQNGGRPRIIARFPVHSLDNAGGFVEIARPQIESFSQRL